MFEDNKKNYVRTLIFLCTQRGKIIMIIPPIHITPILHRERTYVVNCDLKTPEIQKTEPDPSVVAVKGKYLPRNKEVYASSSTVLVLGNSPKNNEDYAHIYFGMDNDLIEDIFRFKGDSATVTVGPQGDLKIPSDWIDDNTPVYLEIRKAPEKKGYYVKSNALYGIKVAPYDDYTNRTPNYPIPRSAEVLIKKDAILNLGGVYELDLASPEMTKRLNKLIPEKEYYIGTCADIEIPDCQNKISFRHLKIRDLGNYYAVQDKSMHGTTIANSKYREKWDRPRPLAQWQRDLMYDPYRPVQLEDKEWYLQQPPVQVEKKEWYLQKPPTLED